jgi:hypothetical protein
MTDSRSVKELQAIRELIAVHNLSPELADNPNMDLLEIGRVIRMVTAVRAAMQPHILKN